MKIYYQNHTGQILDFTKAPYRMQKNTDLFDYSRSYESKGDLNPGITRFKRGLVSRSFAVNISAGSKESYRQAQEYFFEVIEKDVLSMSPGRMYVNDMYLSCYILESRKTRWENGARFLVNEFSLIAESGNWIKESTYVFRTEVSIGSGNNNLDYPYDFKYDFASSMEGRKINNTGIAPVDFEITIYGACLNPAVNIGGHTYRVYASLDTGEYLKINSITKKIYKVKINGEVVNQFNLRERDYYIFEKIQPGINSVTWTGAYGMDVTLFEERSEPRWI